MARSNFGKKAKSNLNYAQRKINELPENDKYRSILIDLYRAVENLRLLIHNSNLGIEHTLTKVYKERLKND